MAPDSQPEEGEVVIPVDRRNPVLGNKHILRNKLDSRERALRIEEYRQDLDRDFARKGPMYQAIRELALRVIAGERLALQCACKPYPCHGDDIAEKIAAMVKSHHAGLDF